MEAKFTDVVRRHKDFFVGFLIAELSSQGPQFRFMMKNLWLQLLLFLFDKSKLKFPLDRDFTQQNLKPILQKNSPSSYK